MPKAPRMQNIPPPANAPTAAQYNSRGQSVSGMGQRPNKKIRPITGGSSATGVSLLGGM
jgi:hypothetical protein